MALGAPILGTVAKFESSLDNVTYSPISDLTSFDNPDSKPITTTPVFQRSSAHVSVGAREISVTFDGLLSAGDTGQQNIRSAYESGGLVWARYLPDGTNGRKAQFRVSAHPFSTGAPGNFQGTRFELQMADAAWTNVGTGIV